MSAHSPKIAPALCALLVGFLLAGCTDPEPIEPRPSPASQEDFAAEMRDVCRPVVEARARLLRSRTEVQLRERSSQFLFAQEGLANEVRSITPPAGAAAGLDRYAEALPVAIETARSVIGHRGDSGSALELASKNAQAQLDLSDAKNEAGLPEACPPYGDLELEAFRSGAALSCHRLGGELETAGRVELDGGSERQTAGLISVLSGVLRDFLSRLEAAAPPELADPLVDRFRALHEQRAAAFDRLGVAYLERKRTLYYRAARDYRRLSLAADVVARRLGIDSCVRFDVPSSGRRAGDA
ncbi:MAG: hypothetical protein M3391_05455 [Actinomycetota bacterium]|nr:hypothetical protein [Actinomycetota bacterium]